MASSSPRGAFGRVQAVVPRPASSGRGERRTGRGCPHVAGKRLDRRAAGNSRVPGALPVVVGAPVRLPEDLVGGVHLGKLTRGPARPPARVEQLRRLLAVGVADDVVGGARIDAEYGVQVRNARQRFRRLVDQGRRQRLVERSVSGDTLGGGGVCEPFFDSREKNRPAISGYPSRTLRAIGSPSVAQARHPSGNVCVTATTRSQARPTRARPPGDRSRAAARRRPASAARGPCRPAAPCRRDGRRSSSVRTADARSMSIRKSVPSALPRAVAPAAISLRDLGRVLVDRVVHADDEVVAQLGGDPAHRRAVGRVALAGVAEHQHQLPWCAGEACAARSPAPGACARSRPPPGTAARDRRAPSGRDRRRSSAAAGTTSAGVGAKLQRGRGRGKPVRDVEPTEQPRRHPRLPSAA